MRGGDAVEKHAVDLEHALGDKSPAVRIVAAQALAEYGSPAIRRHAIETLGSLASPETNGVLVSMTALAADLRANVLGCYGDPNWQVF